MKVSRISRILALSVILALLIPLLPTPVHAAEYLFVSPREGRIGDRIEINGAGFKEDDSVFIYFSSQKAELGDLIDTDVTAYEHLFVVTTDEGGSFERVYAFFLPDALTDGEDVEDVHDGIYYIYAVYFRSYQIVASAVLFVLDGEISLDIEEGVVGTEVEISGVGLRPEQSITIQYDEADITTSGGDSQSDKNGDFTCTIVIPESSAGRHVITAVDETGNTPDTEFTVTPMITVDPTEQLTGSEVQVIGTGFAARGDITITLDGEEVTTTPLPLSANHYGSFEGSFLVPTSGSFGDRTVEARDDSSNKAQAQLAIQGGIMVSPTTSLTSPGYAGMELIIRGSGFNIGSTVTITYSDNGEDTPVTTVTTDDGDFRVEFIVPPSAAGSHNITADDGTSTVTAIFIMEAKSPPTPIPLLPEVAATTGARAHFDWTDVSDDSGISYTLQVAVDTNFNAILLNRAGLETSEYTLTEEEKLASSQEDAPYYWRVKAVDGALNDSGWTYPRLFYIGFSWSALPVWAWYVLGIIVAAVLGILGYWLWTKRARGKARTI